MREWASSTLPAPAASASSDQLAKHLEFMHAALPSRANDTETGRKRFAVYASILAGKSNEALAFMARRACETLDWFPTPKQCLDLIGQYQPPMPAHEHALLACRQYTHSAFGDWLAELRDGAPIGDVPDHWKRIAVEQGDLRRLQDGSYVSRALYHGPACRPYQATPARRPVAKPAPMPAGVVGASAGLV